MIQTITWRKATEDEVLNGSPEMIKVEETELNCTVEELKQIRIEAIDLKTSELISQGFVYSGKTFSMSENAQTNILALYTTRNHPALLYPIKYSTKDDTDSFDAINASVIEEMYLTALGTKRAHLDSGTELKRQINSASTIAEIDLIIDNR